MKAERKHSLFIINSKKGRTTTKSFIGLYFHTITNKMPPKKGKKNKSGDDNDHLTRIAIVNTERCKPKKCVQECKRSCPVVKLGKLCIEVGPKSKLAFISEPLCIGKYCDIPSETPT